MSRRRRDAGSSSNGGSYDGELRDAIARFLPHHGLPLLSDDARVRFTARLLAMLAVLTSWSPLPTLLDRFAQAREAVVRAYATRRRPGHTCEGFARALVTHGAAVLGVLADHWRQCVRELAGAGFWAVEGWALFGVDGSTFDCPRTAANEDGFGVSGKNNSGPQQLLTCLFHVATGILWGWARDGIRGDGERTQLRRMLGLLPAGAMLLADAGLAGYELFEDLLTRGNHFLVRVGGNVKLIRELGYARREGKQTVYLWPLDRQGRRHGGQRSPMPRSLANVRPPLVLRLIELRDAGGRPVFLLTDVTDRKRLTDAAAARMYRLRWGVEVMWRGLKQTMGHRKLLSRTPERAVAELDWAMAGLWLMQLIGGARMLRSRRAPKRYSPAKTLRVLRGAMSGGGRGRRRRKSLVEQLGLARRDEYRRRGSKRARHRHPRKCAPRPPGRPEARMATVVEKRLAQWIRAHPPPKSLAA